MLSTPLTNDTPRLPNELDALEKMICKPRRMLEPVTPGIDNEKLAEVSEIVMSGPYNVALEKARRIPLNVIVILPVNGRNG